MAKKTLGPYAKRPSLALGKGGLRVQPAKKVYSFAPGRAKATRKPGARPRILSRYIYGEAIRTVAAILVLLTLAYTGSRFVQFLAEAAAGKLASDLIAELVALKIVCSLVIMLPLCLYLGLFVALERLDRDRELVAMAGVGLGGDFLLGCALKLALGIAAGTALLAMVIAPWAEGRLYELQVRARTQADITGITPGRFKEFSEGNRVFYAEELAEDRRSMRNVFLQTLEPNRQDVLTAGSATLEVDPRSGSRYVIFQDGQRYEGRANGKDYSVTEYRRYAIRMDQGGMGPSAGPAAAATMSVLWSSQDSRHLAELHWRIAMPISALLLAVLALALLRLTSRSHRYVGLLIAILLYFSYSNLLGIGRTLIKHETLPGYLGLWWVHLLALLLILGLLVWPRLESWWLAQRRIEGSPGWGHR
ncbi:MAG: LPS export ABC transporter permease LptF [Gammaproteobacteria bacterium]